MKVLGQVGKWISFKLDSIAKIFISKSDLLDISLQEQGENIDSMIQAQVQLKTARKNLQDARKDNEERLKKVIANVNQYVKKKKDANAKIEIRAKLEIEKQNEVLDNSIATMEEKEEIMKRKIEMLRQIHLIQEGKVAYFKTVSKATKAQLNSVDVRNNDIDTNKIMQEMSEEIRSMDNRMSALDEMEDDGTISRDSGFATSDSEVDEELDKLKAKIK